MTDDITTASFDAIPALLSDPEIDAVRFDYNVAPKVGRLLVGICDLYAEADINRLRKLADKHNGSATIKIGATTFDLLSSDRFAHAIVGDISDHLAKLSETPRFSRMARQLQTAFDECRTEIAPAIAPLISVQSNAAGAISQNNDMLAVLILRDPLYPNPFWHLDLGTLVNTTVDFQYLGATWTSKRGEPRPMEASHMGPAGPVPAGCLSAPTNGAAFKGLAVPSPHQPCFHTRPAYPRDEFRKRTGQFRYLLSVITR